MSGTGIGHLVSDEEQAQLVTSVILNQLELESSNACRLRELPANQIIAAQTRLARSWPTILPFNAVVGSGSIVPERPVDAIKHGAATGVRILIGSTHDEIESFAFDDADLKSFRSVMVDSDTLATATNAYTRLLSSTWSDGEASRQVLTSSDWWIPAIRVAEAHSSVGGVSWMYRFDWRLTPRGQGFGAPHGLDLAALTVPDSVPNAFTPSAEAAPRFSSVIENVRQTIIDFVTNQSRASKDWIPYDATLRSTFLFDDLCQPMSDPDRGLREVWRELL